MRPLRAARSSSLVAASLSSAVASADFAFLTAVRRAARWARLRTVAARDFRMFFFAEAIFGTRTISRVCWEETRKLEARVTHVNRRCRFDLAHWARYTC